MAIQFCYSCFAHSGDDVELVFTEMVDNIGDKGYEIYIYQCAVGDCHCVGAIQYSKDFEKPEKDIVPPIAFDNPVDPHQVIKYIKNKLDDEAES